MAVNDWKIYRKQVSQKDKTILLCDDDTDFLDALKSELNRILKKLNISCKIEAFSSPASITEDKFSQAFMVFLDIDFDRDDENGISVARRMRQINKEALLFFVTNYIDFAPAGYEVQAFRYVLKRDIKDVLERYILVAMEHFADEGEFLQLYDGDSPAEVPLSSIKYIEVMDHYVSIHAEKSYVLLATLSSLEAALEAHGFLRVHKSYLVNMANIRKFRSRECILANGTALPVGEKNYPSQKEKYLKWKGMQI